MFNRSVFCLRKATLPILFLLAAPPCAAQHAAHTHGKAELNLVVGEDHQIVAELIVPAGSVYGFEHAARNPLEVARKEAGLNKLKAALASMLVLHRKAGCAVTVLGEVEEQAHPHHDHGHAHARHDRGGHSKTHETDHHNVMVHWTLQCGSTLRDQQLTVNWREVLPDIHQITVVLLTPDRQERLDLHKSGTVIRL
ncbi:ZrgA family zinc uptake protein [Acanthopleuribacter pedis]|uniref:DUF2796 domain-containing protein n=1 Tax=Acanthopleuribacter pedis TaxID=442870 RepID=A0A8J7QJ60_9BACT|nr:DUF2796 domain-containing protein [Acanthopleuribacter pedis]MBO1323370.1 DUF2796 domain-containing protein [Acanthopleuribacter pedis]